jgi:broad specificity phosphatase PhoE
VSTRLTLLSHSSTSATNAARFPDDEPLDDRGAARAAQARGQLDRVTRVYCSPALSCRQTSSILGLEPQFDPLLRDWDLGRWRGRTLEDVGTAEPEAVQIWLSAPSEAPHGGESLTSLVDRVSTWLTGMTGAGYTVAVTHPGVVRAAIISTLSAPPEAFWRIDIAPLTATVLRGGPQRWTLRSSGGDPASRNQRAPGAAGR